jgi:hypothetical protein
MRIDSQDPIFQGGVDSGRGPGDAALSNFRAGTMIVMNEIPGFTPRGLLSVPYTFQAPPLDEMTITTQANFNDFMTPKRGEFSRSQGRSLQRIQFGTVFLDYNDVWTVWSEDMPPDPVVSVQFLEKVAATCRPFWLTIGEPVLRDLPDFDMPATLRSVTRRATGGEVDARYVDVEFAEYRDLQLPIKTIRTQRTGHFPVTVTISDLSFSRNQDTLHALALRYYKDPSKWDVIRRMIAFLS